MPRHNADTWTEDRVDRLKQLYVEGYSCSQIARELGVVTRNGVIGKVHRLGLEKRGIPKAQQKTRRFKHQTGRELKRQGNNRRRLNGRAPSDRRQQYPISASKPKPELLEDAARRLLAPRTLTGEIMGDPPVGYSALERRT